MHQYDINNIGVVVTNSQSQVKEWLILYIILTNGSELLGMAYQNARVMHKRKRTECNVVDKKLSGRQRNNLNGGNCECRKGDGDNKVIWELNNILKYK